MGRGFHIVPRTLALFLAAAFAALPQADAAPPVGMLPSNPTVTNGSASFAYPDSTRMVVTNTAGTVIRWDGFSLGSQASVSFNQTAGAASAVLNRVAPGSLPSEIFGRIDSNGRVFLVNPNGIVFGGSAVIDVQGLVASTLDLADDDFLAGRYRFAGGSSDITLQSGATLLTSARGPHGQVWLIAGGQLKTEAGSHIDTALGQTVLAAGSELQVTDEGTGGMRFTVTAAPGNSIEHYGAIAAERGAAAFFADSIVHAGGTSVAPAAGAADASAPPGSIQLAAARDVAVVDGSLIDASGGDNGTGGSIAISAGGRVTVGRRAEISADGGIYGGNAGRIDISGYEVLVAPGDGGFANVHATAASPEGDGVVNIVRGAVPIGTLEAYVPVSYTGGSDWLPNVTFLADGSYVVVWMEMNGPSGTIWNTDYATVHARRFSATGQPLGEPFQISQYTGYQYKPTVAAMADGGFLVLWSYRDDRPAPGTIGTFPMRLYARRFDGNAQALGADFRIDADNATAQTDPAVTSLAGGGFLVSWTTSGGTRLRLFDAGGNAAATPLAALDGTALTTADGTAMAGHFVPYGDGGFAHVYMRSLKTYSPYSTSWAVWDQRQLFVQHYDRNGLPVGGETRLASSFAAPAPAPVPSSYPTTWLDGVAALANGDIVLTQRVSACSTCEYKVYYSLFDAGGEVKLLDQPIDTVGSNLYARVVPLADGGFSIVWEHTNPIVEPGTAAKDNDVFAQRYGADGLPLGAPIALSQGGLGGVDQPRIAAGADGRYVTVWSDNIYVSDTQYSGFEIRSMLTLPGATAPAPVQTAASAVLPAAPFATRPGAANGSPGLIATNPPSEAEPAQPAPQEPPSDEPVPQDPAADEPAPQPDEETETPPVVAQPAPPLPRNTESALNEVRLLTPTGQQDFVFGGAASHFGGGLEVRPVRGVDSAVVGYEVAEAHAAEQPAAAADDDGERRRR